MGARFKFLIGDVNWVDHGGKFYRLVERGQTPAGGRFHVMEIMRWPEREEHETGKYNVSLSEIDLDTMTDDQLRGAMSYVGIDDLDEVESDPKIQALIKLDAFHSYGNKAPLWDQSGNNYRELMAEARRESAALDDPRAHEQRMLRPVNALGATAREFMQGDLHQSAITRIEDLASIASGTDQKRLMFAIAFQRNNVPTKNPIAYVMGYLHGIAGSGPAPKPREQADGAYFDGYRHAVDVKTGRKEPPSWAKEWRP